jgi:hypothetical protein
MRMFKVASETTPPNCIRLAAARNRIFQRFSYLEVIRNIVAFRSGRSEQRLSLLVGGWRVTVALSLEGVPLGRWLVLGCLACRHLESIVEKVRRRVVAEGSCFMSRGGERLMMS